jgi:hypothetical protein
LQGQFFMSWAAKDIFGHPRTLMWHFGPFSSHQSIISKHEGRLSFKRPARHIGTRKNQSRAYQNGS